MEMYVAIKYRWRDVQRELERHHAEHSSEYYYAIRSSDFSDKIERAAQFIYLNRTCWNGLYRVNRQGIFNVPKGSKEWAISPDDDFERASRLLRRARLRSGDFVDAVQDAGRGDLVFFDPPYTVKHNMNGFIKYNEGLFSWSDQVRLRDCAIDLSARGVSVVISNADHESVRELYEGLGEIIQASRHSVLAGKTAARGTTTELLIRLGLSERGCSARAGTRAPA
jgi:DNA adenine methylase